MSRDDFKNFVRTVEHNIFLQEKLSQCKTVLDITLLAKNYGYSISLEDFIHDRTATKFDSWFIKSKIKPLKYLN